MSERPWLWESDEAARRAILINCLTALEDRGAETYTRAHVAALVDWGLRERYLHERYRRAYRAMKRKHAKGTK